MTVAAMRYCPAEIVTPASVARGVFTPSTALPVEMTVRMRIPPAV